MPIVQHTGGISFLAKDSTHFFKNYIESQDESICHFGDSTLAPQHSTTNIIVQRTAEGNFSGRMLQKESVQISPQARQEKDNQYRDTFFLCYSLSAVLIIVALYWSFSKISMAVRGFFSARVASAYLRNFGNSTDFPMALINIGYLFLGSIVVAKQLIVFQWVKEIPIIQLGLMILCGAVVILLYRVIIQQVAAYIFSTQEITKNIVLHATSSRIILALFFLIFSPFAVYSPFSDYFIVFLIFIVLSIFPILPAWVEILGSF